MSTQNSIISGQSRYANVDDGVPSLINKTEEVPSSTTRNNNVVIILYFFG